jgi:hypothetical protein
MTQTYVNPCHHCAVPGVANLGDGVLLFPPVTWPDRALGAALYLYHELAKIDPEHLALRRALTMYPGLDGEYVGWHHGYV